MTPISRRQLVKGMAATPWLMTLSPAYASTGLFQHGVASGDPDQHSVVLWTRITSVQPQSLVSWEIAESADFQRVVDRGEFATNAYRDFTVKVLATQLKPGVHYWYRFRAEGQYSPIGRTKTLPVGQLERVGIALASCSNFAFGFFNAYAAIAQNDAIDVVLHTGDYLYEYGADGWGGNVAQQLGRSHSPSHEIVTLADYRQRHAQYKTDRGSMAMHARHPLIALWDDHESANNPWLGGAQNHQPDTEGDWRSRRAAATQAYFEWMPVREPDLGQSRLEFWRRYSFGDLATLVTLESRHTARAEQIGYESVVSSIQTMTDAREFERQGIDRPGREMLSPRMKSFLQKALRESRAQNQIWRVLGNAIPMAKVRTPDLAAAGITMPQGSPQGVADFVWKGRYDLPLYLDTWDGYGWAREQFYAACAASGVQDLMVLTGDSHSFWANRLFTEAGMPMGVEIGTAGISSPGDFIEQGFDRDTAAKLDQLLAAHNAEVRWTDNLHQGYVAITLQRDRADIDYIAVSTVLSETFTVRSVHRETILPEQGTLGYA